MELRGLVAGALVARGAAGGAALAAAIALALLTVGVAGGSEAAKPRFGGTVVVAQPYGPREPACLAPLPQCFVSDAIIGQVLEGAFEVAPDFTYRPNLVSRVTVQRRPFRLTYHIRRDVRWGDGTPITAHDFVFTHQLLLQSDPRPDDPVLKIRKVRAVDAKTVRVSFSSSVAEWRELFHRIYPRAALAGQDLKSVWQDGIVNPKTGRPTGSGPFLIERWERGRQMTLVRNRYWRPRRPYLDRIVFRFDLPASSRVDVVDRASNRGGFSFRTIVSPGGGWEQIAIRLGPGGHPALQSALVRRALAFGIDRAALLRPPLYGSKGRLLHNGILLTNSRFYEPHWDGYRHRPAEARRLLERAGCRIGLDRMYVCDGRRLSLRLASTSDFDRGAAARAIQAQLKTIGVEVELDLARDFFDSRLNARDFDLALFGYVRTSTDPGWAVQTFGCGGQSNLTGYCNRQVTRKLLQSQAIVDEKTRMRLLNRVDALMARDVPMIPLFQRPWFLAHNPELRGVRNNPWEGFTWNSEDWWLER
jgi:peptide/nickel transport system substrate-binding protein